MKKHKWNKQDMKFFKDNEFRVHRSLVDGDSYEKTDGGVHLTISLGCDLSGKYLVGANGRYVCREDEVDNRDEILLFLKSAIEEDNVDAEKSSIDLNGKSIIIDGTRYRLEKEQII